MKWNSVEVCVNIKPLLMPYNDIISKMCVTLVKDTWAAPHLNHIHFG